MFMLLTVGVVALGVEKGLERAVKFLMPALLLMLILLVGYGFTTGHVGEAAEFLFAGLQQDRRRRGAGRDGPGLLLA
jgi:neurotransmitter:Na+ symporter, NSS family